MKKKTSAVVLALVLIISMFIAAAQIEAFATENGGLPPGAPGSEEDPGGGDGGDEGGDGEDPAGGDDPSGPGTDEEGAGVLPEKYSGIPLHVFASDDKSFVQNEDSAFWAWGDGYGPAPLRIEGFSDGTAPGANEPEPGMLEYLDEGWLDDVTELAAGGAHCLALKEDGSVWGWGDNSAGQIGDFPFEYTITPVLIIPGRGGGDECYAVFDLITKAGKTYYLPLEGSGIDSFDGISIRVAYDPGALKLLDAAAHLPGGGTSEGPVDGELTILSLTDGEIVFAFTKDIPPDREWSGLISLLSFKAASDVNTQVSVSWEK